MTQRTLAAHAGLGPTTRPIDAMIQTPRTRPSVRPGPPSRPAVVGRTIVALVVLAAWLLPASAGATTTTVSSPRLPAVGISTACFTATGPDGRAMSIYGRRYAYGTPAASTPAIVLVHGVATTADSWDLLPRWSVARWLAAAGYVVFTYDRPGYRHSPYAGSGADLTVDANQSVLHDVVTAVRRADYRTGPVSGTCAPTDTTAKATVPHDRVAIIGHSGGGFIASTYPGRYHDVVAMVQANAPSGVTSTDPVGNAALVSSTGAHPTNTGAPIGDPSRDGPAQPARAGYASDLADRPGCEGFNLWRSGAVPAAATVVCNPANVFPVPKGETDSYVAQAARNHLLMPATGRIPVLLAGADHDVIMPGNANALELGAWRADCHCDVSQFVLANTGHAFMAHASLPAWTTRVTTWLRSRGVTAPQPRGVRRGVLPPEGCGPARVTVALGRTGRRVRRFTVSAGGATRRYAGRRRRTVAIDAPYAGAPTTLVTVRIRTARGRLTTLRRTVTHCGPLG